jgi:hypothetical protein
MCARRFLIIIIVLTLLGVAGAFAIFQFGQDVLIRQATPKGHFVPPADEGPNYADDESWIARPGKSDDPSGWRPDQAEQALRRTDASIFYVHPTTYLRNDRWTGPIDDPDSAGRARLFVQSQASALAAAGRVWAPKYRQAAFGAFLLDNDDARKALDLAYADLLRAFDAFLRDNPTGPIILAGHSQGALHLTRLLRERVAGRPIAQRVVAAYVIGWPISVAADLPALGLPACRTRGESRCILSWMTFGEPNNPGLVLDSYEGSSGLTGGERRREDMLCVNPLTGTRDGTAPPAANAGTLVPSSNLASAELVTGRVGARCDKGLLIIEGEIPAMGPYVLPGNNYHVYDYALFWGSIAQDASERLNQWEERG